MTPEEMSIGEALARLKYGELYDRKGDLTKEGYQALERLEGVDLNIRPEPVAQMTPEENAGDFAPMKPEEKMARLEKDIDLLEFKIKRLEEAILLMARGAQMTLKRYSGVGLSDSEFDDLTKKINEINEDLYGEPFFGASGENDE